MRVVYDASVMGIYKGKRRYSIFRFLDVLKMAGILVGVRDRVGWIEIDWVQRLCPTMHW